MENACSMSNLGPYCRPHPTRPKEGQFGPVEIAGRWEFPQNRSQRHTTISLKLRDHLEHGSLRRRKWLTLRTLFFVNWVNGQSSQMACITDRMRHSERLSVRRLTLHARRAKRA